MNTMKKIAFKKRAKATGKAYWDWVKATKRAKKEHTKNANVSLKTWLNSTNKRGADIRADIKKIKAGHKEKANKDLQKWQNATKQSRKALHKTWVKGGKKTLKAAFAKYESIDRDDLIDALVLLEIQGSPELERRVEKLERKNKYDMFRKALKPKVMR